MTETNDRTGNLVGIEFSGSKLRAAMLDAERNLADSHEAPVNKYGDIPAQLAEFVMELTGKFGGFEKFGLTVPGLIDRETKRVVFSTYFPEHEQLDLVGDLEKATSCRIFIENDANAAAFGEYNLGAGRNSRDMFYVTLGKGVGGALIFDGMIWRGASGFAGEFGSVAINSDGMKLEDAASAASIVRRTRLRFHQDHTSSLGSIGEDEIGLSDVIKAAKNGDDFAQMMLQRTGNYVGTAIAGVINLLNVEKIVIGGAIMHAEALVLDSIINRARELSFEPSFRSTQILSGELRENACAVGAALLSARL